MGVERKEERRQAFSSALRIVGRNQAALGPESTEVLLKLVSAAFVLGEINDTVNRYLALNSEPNKKP